MKVDVFDLNGNPVEKINLPKVFSEPVREDLIQKVVIASQANRRQPYGVDPMAGKRTSAHYHGYRRHRYTMMGREMARMPRLHGKTVPFMNMQARFAPHAKGGREAHPPMPNKVWEQKINKKEKQKSLYSAIAATAVKEFVAKRGHKIENVKFLPIVVEDKFQEIKKTKELIEFLKKIGLQNELGRIQEKKIRAGKGKTRGRKYRTKTGPLFVIAEDKGIGKAAENIVGSEARNVKNLFTEVLAPGAKAGRLTIFTKSSLAKLGE